MKKEKKKCEHLWETYRTETRARKIQYREHTIRDGDITDVVEVFCKKCLETKKL